MTSYRVTWEIDVEADSPQDAARQARNFQLDEGAEVGYFTAHWREDGWPTQQDVDLDQLENLK